VAETFHLLEEALGSRCEVHTVLAAESAEAAVEARLRRRRDVRVAVVTDRVFEGLVSTESSQGVIALVRPPGWALDDLFRRPTLLMVLDGLQDPGNAGSILRAADAFGASGVLFVRGSVSPFNSKTMRASAGSLFRMPFLSGLDKAAVRSALEGRGLDIYAAVPAGGKARAPKEADLRRDCAILVGSEAHGVSPELHAIAQDLAIPTIRVESLNAAVAAGILLYEAARQRPPAAGNA
jgi:TrmH family RNA methyltransferase